MKVLVLATDYPNNEGSVSLMYIHVRNRAYIASGIDVTVLNFKTEESYIYDGINVLSIKDYFKDRNNYDVLIVHAANLRNHYKFLRKYGGRFPKYIFFFHGHEVLKIRDTYSTPYYYVKKKDIKNSFLQDIYDNFKLRVWRKYYPSVYEKSQFIFVSDWMKNKFIKYEKIETPDDKTYIIPNNVGSVFEKYNYDINIPKKYDFVTIRSNLDGSKYSIDVVNKLANNNPQYNFLVIGKGEFFSHFTKADNITWLNKSLTHEEIPQVLNQARCALMPTRLDAQGVMMCEMATFGIPLITSDIDICQEISHIFDNVIMINNEKTTDLKQYENTILKMHENTKKNTYFFEKNTVGKEIKIIKGLI